MTEKEMMDLTLKFQENFQQSFILAWNQEEDYDGEGGIGYTAVTADKCTIEDLALMLAGAMKKKQHLLDAVLIALSRLSDDDLPTEIPNDTDLDNLIN